VTPRLVYQSRLLRWAYRLGVARRYKAIALGQTILFAEAEDVVPGQTLRHELEHARQWARYGWRFPFLWCWQCLRYGYAKAPLELAAREAEWGR
jgi:hypothetical protein